MKRIVLFVLPLVFLGLVFSCASNVAAAPGVADPVDVVVAASAATNLYTNLDQAALLAAIGRYQGVCTVSTVNADGSPNLAVFVPGAAGPNHVMFGWAGNATKANVLRTRQAVMSYDVVNLGAETKEARHQGAIVRLVLEDDPAALEQIRASLPEAYQSGFDAYTVLRIVEIRPIG
jgi:hypothetical protein